MGSVIRAEKKTYRVGRLFAARRPIACVGIPPQGPDASQSEFALFGDRDAHALQDAEDVFHDLWGRGGRHGGRVDSSLVDANAEVLGRRGGRECGQGHGGRVRGRGVVCCVRGGVWVERAGWVVGWWGGERRGGERVKLGKGKAREVQVRSLYTPSIEGRRRARPANQTRARFHYGPHSSNLDFVVLFSCLYTCNPTPLITP